MYATISSALAEERVRNLRDQAVADERARQARQARRERRARHGRVRTARWPRAAAGEPSVRHA